MVSVVLTTNDGGFADSANDKCAGDILTVEYLSSLQVQCELGRLLATFSRSNSQSGVSPSTQSWTWDCSCSCSPTTHYGVSPSTQSWAWLEDGLFIRAAQRKANLTSKDKRSKSKSKSHFKSSTLKGSAPSPNREVGCATEKSDAQIRPMDVCL